MTTLATVNGFEIIASNKVNGMFTTKCGTICGQSLEEVSNDCQEYYRHLSVKARKGARVYKYGVYAGFVLLAQFKTEDEAYESLYSKYESYEYQADQPSVKSAQINTNV